MNGVAIYTNVSLLDIRDQERSEECNGGVFKDLGAIYCLEARGAINIQVLLYFMLKGFYLDKKTFT